MVSFIIFASLFITPLMFLLMPARRALVTSYCMLWMFLPIASFFLPGLPPLDKPATIGLGVFIAVMLFCMDQVFQRFRVQWFDVPVLVFALVMPFISAMVNGLGISGAFYEMLPNMFLWVVPYFAGRIVLGDEMGVQELATGVFYGALIYAPLCWFEMLMSPQLHNWVYGSFQHKFNQTIRGWSYRPMVFMAHGLMTTMWMVAGAVCGAWLLYFKRLRWNFKAVSPKAAVIFCLFTAAASNSMGALMLMLVALMFLALTRLMNPTWALVPLLLIAPTYIVVRSTGVVGGGELVALVEPLAPQRAQSLGYRMYSEDAYVQRAWESPVIGWSGQNRYRPRNEEGQEIGASDGLWIIVFGKTGLIGLIAMTMSLLLIPAIAILRQPMRVWRHPRFAASGVLVVLLCIYMIDNLLNAMVNPIYMLAAGALAGFVTKPLGKQFGSPSRPKRPATAQRRAAYDRPVGIAT